jgi:hypothetical protein
MKIKLIAKTRDTRPSVDKKYWCQSGYKEYKVGDVIEAPKMSFRTYNPKDNGMYGDDYKFGFFEQNYYWEVEEVSDKPDLKAAYDILQKNCGIKVGDTVKVLRKAVCGEMGWSDNWEPFMDVCVGKTYKVQAICEYGLTVNGYNFPFFVLEKIPFVETKMSIHDIKGVYHEVTIGESQLKVGCTTFADVTVNNLIERWQKRK